MTSDLLFLNFSNFVDMGKISLLSTPQRLTYYRNCCSVVVVVDSVILYDAHRDLAMSVVSFKSVVTCDRW